MKDMKKPAKNKEKIIRDLVNNFNDRDQLHTAYKSKMKKILLQFSDVFIIALAESKLDTEIAIWEFVDSFVEGRFKPIEE